jgi:hypothetical protein
VTGITLNHFLKLLRQDRILSKGSLAWIGLTIELKAGGMMMLPMQYVHINAEIPIMRDIRVLTV